MESLLTAVKPTDNNLRQEVIGGPALSPGQTWNKYGFELQIVQVFIWSKTLSEEVEPPDFLPLPPSHSAPMCDLT